MSAASPAATAAAPTSRRRVAFAGLCGTLIELYDFVIYGTAAALVFPQTFFPALGQAAGTVASLATLGVAFLARPIGGIIFGHFGDRLGRKRTLVASLLMMGVATALVGLLPPAATIGVLAPIFLVILRVAQGIAAGGEWAGAALFVSEHAPVKNRACWTMFPQLGGTLAITLANLTFLATSFSMSNETFVSWGWRIPFVSSALLVAVGLWIRMGLQETPVFRNISKEDKKSGLPFVEALSKQWRQILLGAGVGITSFSLQYLSNTYLLAYASQSLHLPRNFILAIGAAGGIFLSIGVVAGSLLSDRIGRKKVLGAAHLVGAFWAVMMFIILSNPSPTAYASAVLVAMVIAGVAFGPLSAVLTELFDTRYRYTATGMSYNLTGVIGGGLVPLTAGPITAAFGAYVYGGALAGLSIIAFLCTLGIRETKNLDLQDMVVE